jgi:NitT/TauT family transport system substrate-binding protein
MCEFQKIFFRFGQANHKLSFAWIEMIINKDKERWRKMMLKRSRMITLFLLIVMVMILAACGKKEEAATDPAASSETTMESQTPSSNGKLKIAYNLWIGSAGVFVAEAKEYFKQKGLDVEMIKFASPTDTTIALISGQVDAALTTLDSGVILAAQAKDPIQVVYATDISFGADGIVADKSVKTVQDLKGKKVAVTIGAVNHFLLSHALQTVNLKDTDVELINMAPELTGSAFLSGQVDAAVTWEPFLTQATQKGGNLIYSSKDEPGLIVDTLITTKSIAEKRTAELKKLVEAIEEGVKFLKDSPQEGNDIVSKVLEVKPAEVADMLTGVKLFEHSDAASMIDSDSAKIKATIDNLSKFFIDHKLIEKSVKADEMINNILVK